MRLLFGRRGLMRAGLGAGLLGALRGMAFAATPLPDQPLLVHVFLAGGMDGLNFLSPADDGIFTDMRPADLRVTASGPQAGHRLDASATTDFRLHPEAAPLAELWRDGRLALWPAAGVPQPTRSHFEAQAIMGWGKGRSVEPSAGRAWLAGWTEGVARAAGNQMPLLSLSGQNTTAPALVGAGRSLSVLALDSGLQPPGGEFGAAMLGALHGQAEGPAAAAGRSALAALAGVDQALPRGPNGQLLPYAPARQASYAESGSFGRGLATIARVARLNPGLTSAAVVLGGWDTHDAQQAPYTEKLRTLVRGLAAFETDLRDLPRRWTVLVASEFGRRLRSNRSQGTDHGRAGTIFALAGGGSRPFGLARHFGPWPGLSPEALEEGVDLRVATDYRAAFRQVAAELAPGAPPPFRAG